MKINDIIYWVRSYGPDGKDRVPMYYKSTIQWESEEGRWGDIQARPVSLGEGDYTATYGRDDFEYEDGRKFYG